MCCPLFQKFMLKTIGLYITLAIALTSSSVLSVSAAPKKTQPLRQEVYLGVFGEGENYARDVYILPKTIQNRGNLRRFQKRDVYFQEQTGAVDKHKYRHSISFWAANCQEGSIGVQKSERFNALGNKVSELLIELDLKVPQLGSINEKALDFVCDYKK